MNKVWNALRLNLHSLTPIGLLMAPQIDRWRGIFEGRAPKKKRDSFCSWPQNQKDRFAQRQDAWKWVFEEVWLVLNAAHLRKKEGRASSLPHWGLQISSVGHRWLKRTEDEGNLKTESPGLNTLTVSASGSLWLLVEASMWSSEYQVSYK